MVVLSRRRRAARVAASPRLTREHLAYIGLGILSIVLHLWALDRRALHHDETIHAFYSWNIATGQGYVHDPLTHGPFLYYWTALQYMLFGDSDFTARLSAAIFGVALTLLPWLLRPSIGRGPALLASAYLTISPVVLYVGRFIRHDVFAVTWELLCLIAIVRYAATQRTRWIYIFWAALALMYCTIETAYLFTLTLGTFVLLVTLWRINWRLLLVLAAGGMLMLGALAVLPKNQGLYVSGDAAGGYAPVLTADGKQQLFDLPLVTADQALTVRNQNNDRLFNRSFSDSNGTVTLERGYFAVLGDTLFGSPDQTIHQNIKGKTLQGENGVFLHPGIAAVTVIGLLLLLGLALLIWLPRKGASLWAKARERSPDDVWLNTLAAIWSRHTLGALLLAFAIYTAFFTSFGVHTSGIVSGVTGSLLYWLAQHDVQRGGQPQHYYLVQLLVYEPLLLTVGLMSMLGGLLLLGRALIHDIAQQASSHMPGWLVRLGTPFTLRGVLAPALLAWWAGGSVALYTWAGEKMPWITMHLAAPLTLIAAWGAWQVWRWAFALRGSLPRRGDSSLRQGLATYLGAMTILTLTWTIVMTRMIRITPEQPTGSSSTPLIVLIFAGAALGFTALYATVYGVRRSVGALLLATGLLWSAYSLRSSWRLNYENGDVPVEMMVYVQTSPDVTRVMRGLEQVSIAETGQLTLPIIKDNEQIWYWYTRNFSSRQQISGPLTSPPADDVAAVLLIQDNWDNADQMLPDFAVARFPLRWWFPEDPFYRFAMRPEFDAQNQPVYLSNGEQAMVRAPFDEDSTIGRLVRRPLDARTQNELWRYLLFRQPPAQLNAVDFKIFIRPKYASMLGLPGFATAGNPPSR